MGMTNVTLDGIEVFLEDNDKYLQINDITGADLSRIWEHISREYADYDKWFCYHNTDAPITFLTGIGAVLKDDCIEMHLTADKLVNSVGSDIINVDTEYFDEFAALHDRNNPEMYWTSERIERDRRRWSIFAAQANNRILGYILLETGNIEFDEIYCVYAFDEAQHEALIAYAAKQSFDCGKREVLYMADENSIGKRTALSVGFTVTGFYRGYKVLRQV